MTPLKGPCPVCVGNGTVPHVKRRMENGEPDPADLRLHNLCEKCGGGGAVLVDKARIKEPGNIVDAIV